MGINKLTGKVLHQRVCKRCNNVFMPTAQNQKYCGSQKLPGTCSWITGREKGSAWSRNNPELQRAYRKEFNKRFPGYELKKYAERKMRMYGLTREQFTALEKAAGGRCQICGEAPKSRRVLNIDHCHATGKVRGLLCVLCNIWLGVLESGWPDKAHEYLNTVAERRRAAGL